MNKKNWHKKGDQLFSIDRHKEAIAAYDIALKIEPDNYSIWNNKGFALYIIDEYDQALIAFDKVLEIEPNHAEAWLYKGSTLCLLGDYPKCISALIKAVTLIQKNKNIFSVPRQRINLIEKKNEKQLATLEENFSSELSVLLAMLMEYGSGI